VKISWPLPPAVVDLHAEWMDLEAQLQLRARASPWSPPVDGAHARDAVELGPGWIHAPLGLKVTRRSAAHRPSVRRCAVGCRCSPDPEPPPAIARSGAVVAVRTRTTAAAAPWRCARVGLYQGAARRWRVHPSVGARIGERAHGSAIAR
jgi:hypothetical protein